MIRVFLQVNCRFQAFTTQDTTASIRAFLQVNCRFQVYTTQDTTALVRAFLQVKGVFRHAAGLINVFLQVNPLSPNSDQHQFSPKDIHRLSRDKVMRITKMIIIEKIP